MDWTKTLWKAAKTAAALVLGSVAGALAGPEMVAALGDAADAALSAIPYVGGVLSGPVKAAIVFGLGVAATAIRNAYKHWNDEPAV